MRTSASLIFHLPFNIGHLLLPLVAYYFRNWKDIQIAISAPSLLVLPLIYWDLPESPRWYLAVGRTEDAITTLEQAAIRNDLPTSNIKESIIKCSKDMEVDAKQKASMLDLIRTPNMRKKTIFISFNWLVCGLCYFGLAQFISHLGGDIFVNVAVSAVAVMPGVFVSMWAFSSLGRKVSLISSNMTASIALLLVPFVPESLPWVKTFLSSLGLLALSISFYCVYTYGGELYPTVVRTVGLGTSSMCARVGAMAAPFVASLGDVNPLIPLIVFGTPPVIASVMCALLPETKGCKLPDTLEDGERFGKKSKKNASQPA